MNNSHFFISPSNFLLAFFPEISSLKFYKESAATNQFSFMEHLGLVVCPNHGQPRCNQFVAIPNLIGDLFNEIYETSCM